MLIVFAPSMERSPRDMCDKESVLVGTKRVSIVICGSTILVRVMLNSSNWWTLRVFMDSRQE